jgi:antitoxin component of MazEF toxin-antitoxin module
MLKKKIVKRGDSCFILLSKDLMSMLDLKLGDEVIFNIEEKKIVIEKVVDRV